VANGSFASLKANVQYLDNASPDKFAVLVRTLDFNRNWNGEYVWVDKAAYHFLKKSSLIQGDLVLCNVGSVGIVFEVPDLGLPMTLGPNSVLCRTKDINIIRQRFIYYYFLSSVGQALLEELSGGSTVQPKFNKTVLRNSEIDIPDLAHQDFIAHTLGILDSKISTNAAISKTLEDIAQTIFKSWFIDFDPVKAKMAGEMPVGMDAATSALFPDSMEESELGLIPKGWRVGSLGEIADLQGGYAFKSSSWTESGVPVIKIGSVKPGFVDLTQVSYVDAPTAEAIPDVYRIPAGSLVVGLTGYVGQVGLMRTHDPIPLINQRVAKFKLKSGDWKIPFIYCFTRGEKFKGIVEELATGTAQQNVSNSQILSIPMAIPSEHIREMFDNSFKPFFQDIINLADENESLKSTRDALLPRLISGELPIPEEMLAS
jgi:type I restriction enzyme S subunit